MNRRRQVRIDYTSLFLEPPNNSYDKLLIDRESVSYITTPHNALTITWIIRSNLQSTDGKEDLADITVLDGTSGVGGDVIAFGHVFGSVIGFEIDRDRFRMLNNNVKVYELENVTVINEDCLKVMFDLNFVDVFYLDPPWGGRNYKKQSNLTLSIGNMSVEQIVHKLLTSEGSRSNPKLIVLKLPKNYDLEKLYYKTKNPNYILLKYNLEKMMIMVFKRIDL